jgi:hypothetical protein
VRVVDPRRLIIEVELALLAERQRAERQAATDEMTEFWRTFYDLAPTPLWSYMQDVDAEAEAAIRLDAGLLSRQPQTWLEQRHPAWDDVVDGLEYAVEHERDRLRYTQGVVIKSGYWRLGWWYARERAAGVTGAQYDGITRDLAARALLDWSGNEARAAWQEPERFRARWHEWHTDDSETLAHAGLHLAELRLLVATDA